MGRVLNCLERQQIQMWTLIDAQEELKALTQQQQATPYDTFAIDHLIGQYELVMWQMLAIQMQLQQKFIEIQSNPVVKSENDMLFVTPDDEQNPEMFSFKISVLNDPIEHTAVAASPNDNNMIDDDESHLPINEIEQHFVTSPDSLTPNRSKFECTECKITFSHRSSLYRHMKFTHPNPNGGPDMAIESRKRYVCQTCHKGFAQPSDLNRHQTVHTKERPFVCQHCGRDFTQSHQVIMHIRNYHPTMEECYMCLKCHAQFSKPSDLTNHMNNHSADDPLRCTKCLMTFRLLDTWRQHLRHEHL